MGRGASSWDAVKTKKARAATRLAWAWTFGIAWFFGLALTLVLRFSLSPKLPSPPDAPDQDPVGSIAAGIRHLALTDDSEEAPVLASFYENRDFAPFWTSPIGLTLDGLALIRRFETTDESELPATLIPAALSELGHPMDVGFAADPAAEVDRVSQLEWALSQSFLRTARTLMEGRIPAAVGHRGWHHERASADPSAALRDSVSRGVGTVLAELARAHEAETALFEALEQYRAIEREGGWQPVADLSDPSDHIGRSRLVHSLRSRLYASGDLDEIGRSDTFDEALARALRRFQERHGLEVDGKLGKETLRALNVPVEDRIEQIRVNLERRRWLPPSFGDRYVWVNVPEFRLRAYRGGELAREMNVVVGKPSSKTPLFSEKLAYVVFHPYWYVPHSIAQHELLPRHVNDPSYLSGRGFEVVNRRNEILSNAELTRSALRSGSVRLRRRPGASNDLGTIKFIMPNRHNVYLHDTSSRHLFPRPVRAFSHGCIRVESPEELASYVLDGQLDEADIDRLFAGGRDKTVLLERSIPVHIVYFTAFIRDGVVHFRDDIYGYDADLLRALRDATGKRVKASPLVASAK